MIIYKAQYFYPIDRRWITIKRSKSHENVISALQRFMANEKRFEVRIVETEK